MLNQVVLLGYLLIQLSNFSANFAHFASFQAKYTVFLLAALLLLCLEHLCGEREPKNVCKIDQFCGKSAQLARVGTKTNR